MLEYLPHFQNDMQHLNMLGVKGVGPLCQLPSSSYCGLPGISQVSTKVSPQKFDNLYLIIMILVLDNVCIHAD